MILHVLLGRRVAQSLAGDPGAEGSKPKVLMILQDSKPLCVLAVKGAIMEKVSVAS